MLTLIYFHYIFVTQQHTNRRNKIEWVNAMFVRNGWGITTIAVEINELRKPEINIHYNHFSIYSQLINMKKINELFIHNTYITNY